FSRDWSSDVCSSDLIDRHDSIVYFVFNLVTRRKPSHRQQHHCHQGNIYFMGLHFSLSFNLCNQDLVSSFHYWPTRLPESGRCVRSEERRVGKEDRSG